MRSTFPRLLCLVLIGCGRLGFEVGAPASTEDAAAAVDASTEEDASSDDAAFVDSGADACVPSIEVCNGADDDCDGRADEEEDGPLCGAGETCAGDTCADAMVWAWDRTYAGSLSFRSITTDGSGNIYVTGSFSGSVDFGAGVRSSAGETDLYVMSLTPDGSPRWVEAFGGSLGEQGSDIAIDSSGNLYVIGLVKGSVDFGGGPRVLPRGWHAFVLSLSSEGTYRWDRSYEALGSTDPADRSIAVSATGEVACMARTEGPVDFGDGLRDSMGTGIWSLDSDGGHRWDRTFDSAAGKDLAIADDGSVIVVGVLLGSVDFGGGARTGPNKGFVLRLTTSGTYDWDRVVSGRVDLQSVALDGEWNIYAAGDSLLAVDFGGGVRENEFFRDVFVWSLDPEGNYRWDRSVGNRRDAVHAFDIAVDPAGRVAVGGYRADVVDFGGGEREANGYSNAFIWGLDASGEYRWDYLTQGRTGADSNALASGLNGAVVMAGVMTDVVDLGGGERSDGNRYILQIVPAR